MFPRIRPRVPQWLRVTPTNPLGVGLTALLWLLLLGGGTIQHAHAVPAAAPLVPPEAVAAQPSPTVEATTPILVQTGAPVCPYREVPCGVPLARSDWVITKDYRAHGGPGPWGALDFAIWWNREAAGTPILATHYGRIYTFRDDRTFGYRIYVSSSQWTTIYSHLSAILVDNDQWVVRGQQIGRMGSSGESTGPHVDYQVWERDDTHKPINRNPADFCQCGPAGAPPDPAP